MTYNQSTTEDFIEKARKIHGDRYDYSKVKYVNNRTKVCIICPEHGEFYQVPSAHLSGEGCNECRKEKLSKQKLSNTEDFIRKAKEIHGDKYDYSKVKYINVSTKVCIICRKHGEFWQRPDAHLTNKSGCPKCKASHIANELENFLKRNLITYEREKTFPWLINDTTKTHQFLDFYLPNHNIGIECQGIQHFEPVGRYGGYDGFLKQKNLDENKLKKCKENNVELIYFSYEKNKHIESDNVQVTNKTELLKEIRRRL